MPDQRDDEPGPETPGTDIERALPSDVEPADAEELRQFREFQQFQRYQDYLQAQEDSADSPGWVVPAGSPDAAPEKSKVPGWLATVGSKVLGALLLLAAIVAGGYLLIDYLFGGDDEPSTEEHAKRGGGREKVTPLLAEDPYEAVQLVYDHIAQGTVDREFDINRACRLFDTDQDVHRKFAANVTGEPDCGKAATALHAEITDPNAYVESIPGSVPVELYDKVAGLKTGDTYTIDSCAAGTQTNGITGGPALGTFILTKQELEGQWLITGHRAGPTSCPTGS